MDKEKRSFSNPHKAEWLLIDKANDYFYFKDIQEICNYLDKTKSQVNNIVQQSIKHINKYTNSGYYIQRLFVDENRTPSNNKYKQIKYIYFTNFNFEKKENFIYNSI
tara:strand:- start:3535 stop:3855 length:321 start_codon:yes stop_codon:yes gene_type:complete